MRTVDLVSYLPPFVAEYKEIRETLTAENPEFNLLWDAMDRVLKNEFIVTADEYGISRFEKLLQIFPSKKESLENRRAVVLSRMMEQRPYTYRTLQRMLDALYGPDTAHCFLSRNSYFVSIKIKWEKPELLPKLRTMLDIVLPANLLYNFTYIMSPETIENSYRFSFVRPFIRGKFLFNVQQIGGSKLFLRWPAAHTITNRAKFLARLPTKTEEKFFLPRILIGPYSVDVMGVEGAFFDGAHSFNGSRCFWYTFKRRPAFYSMNLLSGAENRERISGGVQQRLKGSAQNGISLAAGGMYRARDSTGSAPGLTSTAMHIRAKNKNTVTAFLTEDSMWLFDGAYTFGGERRFNAKTERSEL